MKRMIDDSVLTDIADAVREKNGTDNKYEDVEMAQAIRDIPSPKEEQEKVVDITKNGTTEILPDEGKVLSKVAVNVDVPSGGGNYTDEQIISLVDGTTTEFTIPNGAIAIRSSAFASYTGLKNVSIPDSVTTINAGAFNGCSDLVMSSLPNNINYIGQQVFQKCRYITFTKLPENITMLPYACFYGCERLAITKISQKVDSIHTQAFLGCTGLTELTFEGTPTSIATNSFQGCTNLLNIYVPWSEGEVANAPWGATNATIHYNSEVSNAES